MSTSADDDSARFAYEQITRGNYGTISFGPDPRFVNTMDSTRWSFTLFNNWVRCVDKLGDDAPRCQYMYHKMKTITPTFIYEKWEEQLEEGIFPGYRPGKKPPYVEVDYSYKRSDRKLHRAAGRAAAAAAAEHQDEDE